jgi:hypothetical protein
MLAPEKKGLASELFIVLSTFVYIYRIYGGFVCVYIIAEVCLSICSNLFLQTARARKELVTLNILLLETSIGKLLILLFHAWVRIPNNFLFISSVRKELGS